MRYHITSEMTNKIKNQYKNLENNLKIIILDLKGRKNEKTNKHFHKILYNSHTTIT